MTIYTCAHCPASFGSGETAKYHEFWCGKEGGETREIPANTLVNGMISRGEI